MRFPAFIVLVLASGPAASPAHAVDPIYPGIQPKVSAGAGQTVSRGATALFYNPANLIMCKFIEPDLDVAFAQISYSYLHTDAENFPDPAVVKASTPLLTLGAAFRPIPMLAVGFALLPTGDGKARLVPGVPVELDASKGYEAVDIQTSQSGQKIAAGIAFRPAFAFAAGVGIIRTSEKNTLLIYREEQDEPFVDALYGGAFNQFLLGMRSELIDRYLVLGLSYRTATQKKYAGDIAYTIGTEPGDYVPFEGVGYAPGAIGFGVESRFGLFGAFLDYVREQWSGGRAVYRRGIGADPPEKDFVDTNNIVVGAKFWPSPKHMLEAAVGIYGANTGNGARAGAGGGDALPQPALQDDTASDNPRANDIAGIGFGDLEAIPRTVFSGGYRFKLQDHGYMQLGATYQKGSRTVPEGSDGEGAYSISVLSLGAGLAFGF